MDSDKISAVFDTIASSECNTHDKVSALTDISVYLNSLNVTQFRVYDGPVLPFELLFQCLTDPNDVESKLCKVACDVLRMLLETLSPERLLKIFAIELQAGLTHKRGEVRELCCLQLDRVWSADKSLLIHEPRFLQLLIDCLCMEAEKTDHAYRVAHQLLVKIGTSDVGSHALFTNSSSVLSHLNDCLNRHNSTIWFRIMEVVVNCSSQLLDSLRLCKGNGLLDRFIEKVKDSTDILSQSVAIEMLEGLGRIDEGYDWLIAQDVLTDLVSMLSDEENPLASFVQPNILKFFGAVTLKYPDRVYASNDKYYVKLCTLVSDTRVDDPLLMNALDSLTATVTTSHGKVVLNKTGPTLSRCLRRVGGLAKDARTELRQVALCCLAQMMAIDTSDTCQVTDTRQVSDICQHWYDLLGDQPLQFLLHMSKAPFADLRHSVLHVYISLAGHTWAQKVMRDHPTFMEYLVDRETENEQEGHHLKYSVVSTLVKSPSAQEVFSTPTLMKLRLYEKQGPIFKQPQSLVATDEG